jgi:EAL domain-containing protein (putative c-di-GMP-specific phosphodiesterase class I)
MKQIISTCGAAPEHITLELTESVLIERLSAALPNLLQMRDMGMRISIDDFGTGYSSLSALQDLPISEIKIDRSFVRRMGAGESGGEEVVSAIIALGRSMDKRVIGEGIETAAQYDQLLKLGCERGQGFLLGRPMNADSAVNIARESAVLIRAA